MIRISDLSFGYGEEPLYEGVNFIIAKGHKVGLVGANGSGKSTLLKIIMGKEDGFKGDVEVSGNIGLVPQEVKYDPLMEDAKTVREYVDPDNIHPDFEIKKMFAGLELNVDLSDNPNRFSGGQKTKLALSRALLASPDVLLLDEPTNFMDIAGKQWVMKFLSDYDGTVVVISHDLELMDRAINKILFVDPSLRKIEEYRGNYSDFVKLRKQQEDLLKRQLIAKEKHIKQMEEGLKKMARFTSKKGVRARVRQQRRIEREKEALPEAPKEIRSMKVSLPTPAKVGELPIKVVHLNKSYGDHEVLRDVNFVIERGQRIALIGPNGVGKSTFIKCLMGLVVPDSGEVVKNDQLKVGYYSQEFETFNFSKTILETFTDATKTEERFARAFLGRYMFLQDKVFQRVGSLSGGKKQGFLLRCLWAGTIIF